MRSVAWSGVDCSEPAPLGALVLPPPELVPGLGDPAPAAEIVDWSESVPVEVAELSLGVEPVELLLGWSEPEPVGMPRLLLGVESADWSEPAPDKVPEMPLWWEPDELSSDWSEAVPGKVLKMSLWWEPVEPSLGWFEPVPLDGPELPSCHGLWVPDGVGQFSLGAPDSCECEPLLSFAGPPSAGLPAPVVVPWTAPVVAVPCEPAPPREPELVSEVDAPDGPPWRVSHVDVCTRLWWLCRCSRAFPAASPCGARPGAVATVLPEVSPPWGCSAASALAPAITAPSSHPTTVNPPAKTIRAAGRERGAVHGRERRMPGSALVAGGAMVRTDAVPLTPPPPSAPEAHAVRRTRLIQLGFFSGQVAVPPGLHSF
ncbi:hypothetical protein [Amycolatopsis sp. FDAARGOS 1241]|uniref:hypothetical protein n=1 Tax=Amycolatopsis sp. FDAARGOS 1241 TaxID=2778070 RepID=UPI0019521F28|nr:hypothetical protein [Amycolatopsis sp. FDAARGOS 1241]QRP45566.1 hypothetical protein I6J71_41685 [Amycolatopsis sp. FDAARGOS 1241]